jgi:hypothetical protein
MVLYYIYCIWVKTENGVLRYYGHTENMRVRKSKHVSDHKRWVAAGKPEKVSDADKATTRSVYVLDHEDWRMDIVDKIECETKDEARTLEGKWIFENDCVNMYVAGRTQQQYKKQYNETHKEQLKEYQKQYRQDNKEQLKEYQKEYQKQYRQDNPDYNKQYYEDHKEELAEQKKQHYEQNKAEISAKKKEKVTCDICGLLVRKDGISKHHKTKKCLAAKISQQNTNANALSPNP